MELIREIRDLDSNDVVIKVPDAFRHKRVEILIFPLENLEEETHEENLANETVTSSGLCGIWEDERSSEEIINDLRSKRKPSDNQ